MTIELLSPAGSISALKASINAGADACYLGGECFSARKHAKNFSLEEIEKAIQYAHKYNRKIYIAINTLIYNDEIATLIDYIYELYKLNVDALIIQDMAVFQIIKEALPQFEIHASTQMAILNTYGAQYLKSIGFHRVVLARETSIEDMSRIKEKSGIECEVFIQGALCISYSGLCLMSSLIGGRSGNRGDCTQPCRRKYHLVDKKNNKILNDPLHFLSPKDLSLATQLPQIINAGIDSLKIEGRMKQDEYVYLTTSQYRYLIDNYNSNNYQKISTEAKEKMKKIFSRGDYTEGFSVANPYNKMMAYKIPKKNGIPLGLLIKENENRVKITLSSDIELGDGFVAYSKELEVVASGFIEKIESQSGNKIIAANKNESIWLYLRKRLINKPISSIYLTYDKSFYQSISNQIKKTPTEVKKPLKFFFTAKLNMPIQLVAIDSNDKVVEIYSDYIIEPALQRETTKKEIREKLEKFGNTPYYLDDLVIMNDSNVFIPASILNHLRQEVLNKFTPKEILLSKNDYLDSIYDYLDRIPPSVNCHLQPKIVVKTSSIDQACILIKENISKLIINLSYIEFSSTTLVQLQELMNLAQEINVSIAYTADPILNNKAIENLYKNLEQLKNLQLIDTFYVSNLGYIPICNELNISTLFADTTLNITNDLAIDYYMKAGFSGVVMSLEMTAEKLQALSMIGNISTELVVHGRLVSMYLAHDIYKSLIAENILTNKQAQNELYLINDHNDAYKIIKNNYENTLLVNNKTFHVFDSLEKVIKLGLDSIIMDFTYFSIDEMPIILKTIALYNDVLSKKISLPALKLSLQKLYQNQLTRSHYL